MDLIGGRGGGLDVPVITQYQKCILRTSWYCEYPRSRTCDLSNLHTRDTKEWMHMMYILQYLRASRGRVDRVTECSEV